MKRRTIIIIIVKPSLTCVITIIIMMCFTFCLLFHLQLVRNDSELSLARECVWVCVSVCGVCVGGGGGFTLRGSQEVDKYNENEVGHDHMHTFVLIGLIVNLTLSSCAEKLS